MPKVVSWRLGRTATWQRGSAGFSPLVFSGEFHTPRLPETLQVVRRNAHPRPLGIHFHILWYRPKFKPLAKRGEGADTHAAPKLLLLLEYLLVVLLSVSYRGTRARGSLGNRQGKCLRGVDERLRLQSASTFIRSSTMARRTASRPRGLRAAIAGGRGSKNGRAPEAGASLPLSRRGSVAGTHGPRRRAGRGLWGSGGGDSGSGRFWGSEPRAGRHVHMRGRSRRAARTPPR
jgi:hypothetical protein